MDFDLAEWVCKARERANLTQEDLAHRVGLGGKANISAFETGRSMPTFKTMWQIGQECRYPLPQNQFNQAANMQITNNGTQNNTTNNISNNLPPNDIFEEFEKNEEAPDDSMHPVIPQGSFLCVDKKNLEIREGKTYLIKLGGWKTVRRLFRLHNQEVRISARNPDYPDEVIPLSELQIVGRVVAWQVTD